MTTGPTDPKLPGQSRPGQPDPYPGAPQYGTPQYGAPQYGAPQYQPPQYGGQQPYPAGMNQMGGPGRPADLLPRFGARILDQLIVGIPCGIVMVVLAFIGGATGSVGEWTFGVLAAAIYLVAFMGYFSWMEANKGQTLGKQICNLRTEGPNGGNPTMEQAFKRNAFYLISFGGMLIGAVLSIGFLGIIGAAVEVIASLAALAAIIVIAVTINSSATKQGKHDEFAGGTRVVTSA